MSGEPWAEGITAAPATGADRGEAAAPEALAVESWAEFRDSAAGEVPCLVEGVWPAGSLGFIAAPPKDGKTWLAILLAVAVASGAPFCGRYPVPRARPVLYVALEGSRAGLRARVGALGRGMGLDPDGEDLAHLHFLYRPAGMDLTDPTWGRRIVAEAERLDAGLVLVDVLRRAASVRESGDGAADFARVIRGIEPALAAGRSVGFCHHFGKSGETNDKRSPGERMAGSGALFGALDVALYITASSNGARDLMVQADTRELATPAPFRLLLEGTGTAPNGGFGYRDRLTVACSGERPPSAAELMAEQVTALRAAEPGITKTTAAARLGTGRTAKHFSEAWELAEGRVCAPIRGAHTHIGEES